MRKQLTKERTYPELVGSGRCRLVVLAMEVGGRWSAEAAQFLRLLAQTKAQSTPQHLRQATVTALISRWSAILTHAGMQAFASSLLSIPTDGATNGEGALPPLGQLLTEPLPDSTMPSRLPGRWDWFLDFSWTVHTWWRASIKTVFRPLIGGPACDSAEKSVWKKTILDSNQGREMFYSI